ncbi:hypothetical protein EDB86DRAFT_2825709 [Lactarius hatsudake]|nr:hypothetical protein EDB86DRAFT_2825709 [Lactarius hatsudake]
MNNRSPIAWCGTLSTDLNSCPILNEPARVQSLDDIPAMCIWLGDSCFFSSSHHELLNSPYFRPFLSPPVNSPHPHVLKTNFQNRKKGKEFERVPCSRYGLIADESSTGIEHDSAGSKTRHFNGLSCLRNVGWAKCLIRLEILPRVFVPKVPPRSMLGRNDRGRHLLYAKALSSEVRSVGPVNPDLELGDMATSGRLRNTSTGLHDSTLQEAYVLRPLFLDRPVYVRRSRPSSQDPQSSENAITTIPCVRPRATKASSSAEREHCMHVHELRPSVGTASTTDPLDVGRDMSKGIIMLLERGRWETALGASTACAVRRVMREGRTTSVFSCSAQLPASNGTPPRQHDGRAEVKELNGSSMLTAHSLSSLKCVGISQFVRVKAVPDLNGAVLSFSWKQD